MLKFQLQSGSQIEINLASVEAALHLYRTLMWECQKAGLDITIADDTTIAGILQNNIKAILNILGSEIVLDAIKGCCDKVLYNKERFNMEIFEDEKARADFFPLMILVGVENLRPFFPNLNSVYSIILSQILKA